MSARKWIQLRHLAAVTGVDERTLRHLTASGVIPSWQWMPGRSWRLYGVEALEWFERQGVTLDYPALASILSDSSDSSEYGNGEDTEDNGV